MIVGDRAGRVWIGGGGGLTRFDQGHFTTLTEKNGLPGASISGIVQDDDGFLWLAGSLGILRVSPQELEKALQSSSYRMQGMSLDASDGLRGIPRQYGPFPTAARTTDGRLWFATSAGVAAIDPKHLPGNQAPPLITIEAVKADDHALEASTGIQLPPNTRNLEIAYAGLGLTAPERVRFRYKLEGFDDDWRGPVSTRTATYTNLPPRNYRFRVIACNNDGVWNQEGAVLEFSILPAFYQTKWFLLLCLAAAVGFAGAAYQWRIRRIAAALDAQFQERLSERMRIAQDLHDTLLQSVLSASMQLHVANDQLPTDLPAKPIVSNVLDLMKHAIDEGRNALRGMRLSGVESNDLEQALARIRQEVDGQQKINFHLIVKGQTRPLHPLIRDEVYRIGREAIINTFRHSQATSIEVELTYTDRGLQVVVRDDGCGIDPQILRSGREAHWGLSGMRERADRIAAKFKIWSRPIGGTEVELSVPGHVAFQPDPSRRWLRWLARGSRRGANDAQARENER
jgi:signal transduction histidine kinase